MLLTSQTLAFPRIETVQGKHICVNLMSQMNVWNRCLHFQLSSVAGGLFLVSYYFITSLKDIEYVQFFLNGD